MKTRNRNYLTSGFKLHRLKLRRCGYRSSALHGQYGPHTWSIDQGRGRSWNALLHERSIARRKILRLAWRREQWNRAVDLILTEELISQGFVVPPSMANMSAEEAYAVLAKGRNV